jgi:rubrerythrin
MAFQNPFPGLDKPLSNEDLIRAIRLDLAAEEEATYIYTAHADATNNPIARKVLLDIANEERVHAGEFKRLLQRLAPKESELQLKGYNEVDKILEEFSPEEIRENLQV